jgi:hypothetical protein
MTLLNTVVLPLATAGGSSAGDRRRVTAELVSWGGCNDPSQSASECLLVASLETTVV